MLTIGDVLAAAQQPDQLSAAGVGTTRNPAGGSPRSFGAGTRFRAEGGLVRICVSVCVHAHVVVLVFGWGVLGLIN